MLSVCKDSHQQNCSHTAVIATSVVCHHCGVSYCTIMAKGLNLLASIAIGELYTYYKYIYKL